MKKAAAVAAAAAAERMEAVEEAVAVEVVEGVAEMKVGVYADTDRHESLHQVEDEDNREPRWVGLQAEALVVIKKRRASQEAGLRVAM